MPFASVSEQQKMGEKAVVEQDLKIVITYQSFTVVCLPIRWYFRLNLTFFSARLLYVTQDKEKNVNRTVKRVFLSFFFCGCRGLLFEFKFKLNSNRISIFLPFFRCCSMYYNNQVFLVSSMAQE